MSELLETFDNFDMIVEECKSAIFAINNSSSPEDDVEPLKDFCQGLVDLRYIVKNSNQLIKENVRAEEEKKERLEDAKKNIEKAKDKFDKNMKLESFSCFKELNAFKEESLKNSHILEESMLSTKRIGSRGDNKFLMEFHKQEIHSEDLKCAKSVWGLKETVFTSNPVFFDLKVGHTALLINAPSEYFGEIEFDDKIRNIYFSFASNMQVQELLIAPVEHESVTDAVLSSLENAIRKELNDNKSDDGIYLPTAKKDDEILSGIEERELNVISN